jgi:GNAT superfamily N-acetyltransferase
MPDDLLENHLAFLTAHRGEVRRSANAIEILGESEEFSAWIPLSPAADLPAAVQTVRLIPSSGPGWENRLLATGFEPAEVLVHLVSPPTKPPATPEPPKALAHPEVPAAEASGGLGPAEAPAGFSAGEPVPAVDSDEDALGFAEVQSAAFLEVGEPDYDWWQKMFVEKALQNYRAPDQSFYLLRVNGEPASSMLVLRTGSVVGIYAVATKPQYRRRGLATRLLNQARRDAAADRLTLQVLKGSPAERLYLNLGFHVAFASPHFRRP